MVRPVLHRHGSGVPLRNSSNKYITILLTFLVTITLDALLRNASVTVHEPRASVPVEVVTERTVVEEAPPVDLSDPFWGDIPDASSSPHWEMPEKWKSKVVVAIPMSPASEGWIKVSRLWRRGVRAALVADFLPSTEQLLDADAHAEQFVLVNSSDVPYSFFGKAAMVPSLAHEALGDTGYEWMLYGDDDTIWHMDSVIEAIKNLDPSQPHMITDHFWFWGHGAGTPPYPEHPSPAAPRCVPCGYNTTGLQGAEGPSGFMPPQACPSCTWKAVCEADVGRRHIYDENCGFKPRYPPEGELIAHGGAGIILSVGLLRTLPSSYMRECISTKFGAIRVPGGDTLFSHCVFFTGVAPTDPGYFFRDTEFNAFDQGGQLVRQSIDLVYHSLKRGCCSPKCRQRLKAAMTVHMRSLHFKEPEAAMDVARMIVRLREVYLRVRDLSKIHEDHEEVPMVWDVHKVCY